MTAGFDDALTPRQVRASDGRRLDVVTAGDGTRGTVIVHHGTPGAAALFGPLVAAGSQRGLRHVSYSRPGYGGSDRREDRSVASCATDVAAVADAVGAERFYTAGWSGGGPHALACAALLGDRVLAAASIAGVAPRHAEGLDWSAGMGEENIEEFAAADAGAEPLEAFLVAAQQSFGTVTAEQIQAALGDLLSEVDRAALTGAYADHLAETVRAALQPGIWGWFDDDLAFMRDWGFDLGDITVPTAVWQGAQDRFVPYSHGEWLAAHVAGAHAELRPDHGHLSLTVGSYGEILDQLVAAGSG